jgi:hypothetical protein
MKNVELVKIGVVIGYFVGIAVLVIYNIVTIGTNPGI